MKTPQSAIFRYGIGIFFVAAALGLSLAFEPIIHDGFLLFFLVAVILAGWFGRTGAGLLSVAVSMVVVGYYFIAPHRAFAVDVEEIPYFLTFLSSAVITSWLGAARRAAEEKQKAYLDELFEQTPEAIMLVDLQDHVLRVNKEFTLIFEYKIEEIVNRPSIGLIVPHHLQQETIRSRERLSEGHYVNVETVRQRKDGSQLNVSEISFPVVVNGKRIANYIIYRDITERRRAQDELQKAQTELAHLSRITTMGELAASIAHEINQPIGAIATNGNAAVRWLGQQPPQVNEAEEALGCIVRDANRAAEVIRRIRSLFSKNSTPMVHLDLNEVVREVLVLTAYETNRRGVAVHAELTNALPPVVGDRVQLQQVLLNLILNSLDALTSITDRAREIRIKSSHTARHVALQVEDTGTGWDEQNSAAIFDAFFTTKKNGIGMGLTITRSIIENHGGNLRAERAKPYGAILTFTLPLAGRN
jgi:PAS domain S-box-containing protein